MQPFQQSQPSSGPAHAPTERNEADFRLPLAENLMHSPDGYWFRSPLFAVEPGEDEETNPRRYGRQLANWLKARLEQHGYAVEDVISEDWGRCLMCGRDPFLLWVGCGNVVDYSTEKPDDPPPRTEEVVWHCFAAAEVSFWKRLLKKVDAGPAVAKLHSDLGHILRAEPQIVLIGQP